MRVRPDRVRPVTIPRIPPTIMLSLMNVPTRPASEIAASPRRGRCTYPISAVSTCQLSPTVATKPNPIACVRLPRDCAPSVVDKAPHATNIDTMDRRTFVLLTGAASAALWRFPHPRALRAAGSLRFDLDDQRRLALWYNAPDRSIPLLRNAAVGVWIGDTLATLADLEDVSVWIEAEFLASDSEARGAVTITIYPDRVLATIRGIRFFATSEPEVLPGDGALVALVSGYQSWSGCHITALPADATSYGAIGLTRAGHGLAAVWDPGEAGEGKVINRK